MSLRSGQVFSYNISRPYPVQYNYVIIPAAIVLTILFSFVAVASDGYQFQSAYYTDVNATMNDRQWFQKAPFSWLADMSSSCDASPMLVGDTYSTSNFGFQYTLSTITQKNPDNSTSNLPTIPYLNSTLTHCDVSSITIEILRRDNSPLARNYWAWGATQASAIVGCNTWANDVLTQVSFTHQLPASQFDSTLVDNLANQHANIPGVPYGLRILWHWYGQISTGMGYSIPGNNLLSTTESSWGSGWVTLSRNSSIHNFTDPSFFTCQASMSSDDGGLNWMNPPNTINDWNSQWLPNRTNYGLPNISLAVDAFGKTYYSLLLSDLGSNNTNYNALISSAGINYLQSVNNTYLADATAIVIKAGLAHWSSSDNSSLVGVISPPVYKANSSQVLNTATPVTLFVQYLCSVPRRKGGFSLFFSVVLADVVFLGACWSIFGFLAMRWLRSGDTGTDWCQGCVERKRAGSLDEVMVSGREARGGEAIGLVDRKRPALATHVSAVSSVMPELGEGRSRDDIEQPLMLHPSERA